METLIKLENVEKTYKLENVKIKALNKISLDIYKNDFVAILGPSGSGKSTIVNMIGCLDVPTNGTIYLKGHDIAKLSESSLAEIRGKTTGFVFQSFNLIPTLTAIENVLLPSIFVSKKPFPNFSKKFDQNEKSFQEKNDEEVSSKNKAKLLLEKVELGHRLYHKPNQLSGGEKQRVAIARSLINDPEVIIADEPTGNLDSKTGKEIMNLLTKLHDKEKKTIVLVTHDLELAKTAKRKVYIKDGKIIQDN